MISIQTAAFARPMGLVACIALALLSGCAGENARLVALQTLKATAEYEQQLDRKITAEREFYATQLQLLSDGLAATGRDGTAITSDAKLTWLFGHIKVTTHQDALRTAGRIMAADPGEVSAEIVDYVARGIAENWVAIEEVRAERKALALKAAQTLGPIEKQKKRLGELRKGLTALAAAPSASSRLAEVKAIAEVVAAEIRKGRAKSGS